MNFRVLSLRMGAAEWVDGCLERCFVLRREVGPLIFGKDQKQVTDAIGKYHKTYPHCAAAGSYLALSPRSTSSIVVVNVPITLVSTFGCVIVPFTLIFSNSLRAPLRKSLRIGT